MGLLINIGASYVGLLFFVLVASKDKIFDENYTLKQHFKESKNRWIWGLSVLTICALIYHIAPDLVPELLSSLGVEVSVKDTTGMVLFGILGNRVGKIIKNRVGKN